MANHDLVLGQNNHPDLALGQNHHHDLVIGGQGGHGLVLSHTNLLGLGHAAEHDLGLGHSSEHDLGLGQHPQDDHDDLGLGHSHQLVLGHHHHHSEHGHHVHHGYTHELGLGPAHDHDGSGDSLDPQGHELGLPDSHHELSVISEPHGLTLDHHLDQLSADQVDDELALQQPQPAYDFSHGPLAVAPPVVQSRRLVVAPEHQLAVGQEFSDVKSCRRAIRDTAIACHFEIQTVKSDKSRFTARCAAEGCPWRIHAAKLPGVLTFTIRTINDSHSCIGINHLGHHQASVQWVANSVEQRLRENPQCKPKEILEEIHRMHGITLSYKQAWRGKERIMAAVRGSFEEGYRLLPEYCRQVERTNPGSIARVYGSPEDNSFCRLFVAYYASIYGFVYACRPLIGLDRTPLKSKYLGTLLIAAGFDGDGALFPLAFGVVDEETDENWIWFLSELRELLEKNTENMPRLTILSDRRKGIVDGVEFNFPTAFHGFCMRHLSESFRKEFNNPVLINLLWQAAAALTAMEFETKLMEIEEVSHEAAIWVRQIPPRLWATSSFEGTRYGHLTAGAVMMEDGGGWMAEAAGLPIVQMMETVRRQLMTWFNERREASMQWATNLVPTAERRVAEALEQARVYQANRANDAEFEVVAPHEMPSVVDIRNRICFLCQGWQLCGVPCAHAVAALVSCRQNVHKFAESWFTVATYRKTYSQTIHPIPDKSMWKETAGAAAGTEEEGFEAEAAMMINPPRSVRAPGRPRKKRVRAEDRGRAKRVVHCSRCNQTGHFRTTCAAPI